MIEGKVKLRLPTPDTSTRPDWWLQAMAYAHAQSASPAPRAVPQASLALVLVCQYPVHVPCVTPAPPPPPVKVCIKRRDRYSTVDAAQLDLGDHKGILTPPGGSPLVITTPIVAKATYDKATLGLLLIPWATGAQILRDAGSKGWSVGLKSYVNALQQSRLACFKVLGARALGRRDSIYIV